MIHITSIKYKNYKSFKDFSIALNDFNILVGPNNAGKSTIIGSLKILAEGIKKAKSKKPQIITNPEGNQILGYSIDLKQVPVATENVFYNYNDDEPAIIRFRLSDSSIIQIFFPERETCFLNIISDKYIIRAPKDFKNHLNIEIGFVPILGPVDHKEQLYQKEAARLALLTYRASRNFRNIWYHYPDNFDKFKELVVSTWPGMDIEFPEVDYSGKNPVLNMFCPEERIPREIFWAGFGFQVWCQMLTYIIKGQNSTLFLIDEPDIYLHSDLQRQLLTILKGLGPDIIIATHSTELISEAELNDILIINKTLKSAKRIKDPTQLQNVFNVLGSNLNPILTQIAKSKRVLFVEGKDFTIFSKFARKFKKEHVANRVDFAVVPIEGFNPKRLRTFKAGIEKTIGGKIISAVIFDKDYRSYKEIEELKKSLNKGNIFVHIHSYKEIENFLIIPNAIEKAIRLKIDEYNKRTGKNISVEENINDLLLSIAEEFKLDTQAQLQSYRLKFERSLKSEDDDSVIIKTILSEFETEWKNEENIFRIIPGKNFLSKLNEYLQNNYKISLTITNIINAISKSDIPQEMIEIIDKIEDFRKEKI